MPFLVFSGTRPKFSEFLNGANFKRIPSAQVTNFGHFSSKFGFFVKIGKFERFRGGFIEIEGQK